MRIKDLEKVSNELNLKSFWEFLFFIKRKLSKVLLDKNIRSTNIIIYLYTI